MLVDYLALLALAPRLLVLLAHPDTLNKHEIIGRKDLEHFARLAFFIAGADRHGISFFYMQRVHTVIRLQGRAK